MAAWLHGCSTVHSMHATYAFRHLPPPPPCARARRVLRITTPTHPPSTVPARLCCELTCRQGGHSIAHACLRRVHNRTQHTGTLRCSGAAASAASTALASASSAAAAARLCARSKSASCRRSACAATPPPPRPAAAGAGVSRTGCGRVATPAWTVGHCGAGAEERTPAQSSWTHGGSCHVRSMAPLLMFYTALPQTTAPPLTCRPLANMRWPSDRAASVSAAAAAAATAPGAAAIGEGAPSVPASARNVGRTSAKARKKSIDRDQNGQACMYALRALHMAGGGGGLCDVDVWCVCCPAHAPTHLAHLAPRHCGG